MLETDPTTINGRVLVVDDEETVRESFKSILAPKQQDWSEIDDAGARLFGDGVPRSSRSLAGFRFEVECASSGESAVEMVRHAQQEGRPYAVAFVDVRMPGWDGLETVLEIRKIDKRMEIIFVTAYADRSVEEIVRRAGANVGYQCKPFDADVIRQIATKAVFDWNKLRGLEALIEKISELKARPQTLDSLLANVLHQVSELLRARSAMLVQRVEQGGFKSVVSVGPMADPGVAKDALGLIADHDPTELELSDSLVFCPLGRYGVIVAQHGEDGSFDNERLYLVRLFLEHASQALENAHLQDELVQREKLSAVGQAIAMVAHDLRGPLGSIRNLIELASESISDEQQLGELHELALESSEEAMHLVEDLLDFVRKTPLDTERVEVANFLEELRRATASRAEQWGGRVEIDDRSASAVVDVDSRKLTRALENLVRNGLEAQKGRDDAVVAVRAVAEDQRVVIEVEDRGPGIPEKIADRLFEPFVTEGKSQGTGLGLAIAKHVVEGHEGTLELAETSEEGTRFRVLLPRALAATRSG
jgi:signal transduction histidine kinase